MRASSTSIRILIAFQRPILPPRAPKWMPSSPSTCSGTCATCRHLREAAPGKPFIEDCAQALGSRLDGRLAGSFGEIAVFSFRSGKYISVGEGRGGVLQPGRSASLESRNSSSTSFAQARGRMCSRGQDILAIAASRQPLWGLIGSSIVVRLHGEGQLHVPGPDRTGAGSIETDRT